MKNTKSKNRPTLAFATMCKDEEHCILECLESVKPYVDYILVNDTGSSDKTIQIVKKFLKDSGIPGEVFETEWTAFDVNKNQMMERVKDKTDYVLHFDADDYLRGEFEFNEAGLDQYQMKVRRGSSSYSCSLIYNNRLTWKFCGVAHTIIKCIDKEGQITVGHLEKGYLESEPIGSRAFDPEKYLKDGKKLEEQFWNTLVSDPDGLNRRSVFYTAQSYMDYGIPNNNEEYILKSMQFNRLYLNLENTWIEERFEARLRVARCMIALKHDTQLIIKELDQAIQIFNDRAEPYYILGQYLNNQRMHSLAYEYLMNAKSISYENASTKYQLFVIKTAYGKYINDELSVSCYWLGKYDEGVEYLKEIIDDSDFEHVKVRLERNLDFFNSKISK